MNADALLGNRSRRRRGRRVSWLFMIVAVLSLAAASCGGHPAPATSSPPVNALTVKACTVDGLAARCGTLIVPEDRLTGTGRTVPVRFVVFAATGPDRAPDPPRLTLPPGDHQAAESSGLRRRDLRPELRALRPCGCQGPAVASGRERAR